MGGRLGPHKGMDPSWELQKAVGEGLGDGSGTGGPVKGCKEPSNPWHQLYLCPISPGPHPSSGDGSGSKCQAGAEHEEQQQQQQWVQLAQAVVALVGQLLAWGLAGWGALATGHCAPQGLPPSLFSGEPPALPLLPSSSLAGHVETPFPHSIDSFSHLTLETRPAPPFSQCTLLPTSSLILHCSATPPSSHAPQSPQVPPKALQPLASK